MATRVLIVGGFGFVGGRLAAYLAQKGCQVVIGSRMAVAPPTWLPQSEVKQIDWDDAVALERVCKGVDVVVHAAGMNAQDCATDPVAALEFNGLATARLVAAACRTGVQRYIYLSTAHVYASPLIGTITEETCPRNLHPYATSHLAGEQAVLGASFTGQIHCNVLRLSNIFGTPMHVKVNCWMLLVNDLCRQAVKAQRLTLRTDGGQHRDFVPMAAVVRAIDGIIENSIKGEGGIFNIGSGASKTLLEMTELIRTSCEKVLGFKPELQAMQKEEHHPINYRSERLGILGLYSKEDEAMEIERLLRFCNEQFRSTEK